MQSFFYAYFMLGSFSLGYSLLRIGFPKKQGAELIEKIVYSYLLGLIIFGTGLIAGEVFGLEAFIIFSLLMYFFLICIMFVARTATRQNDSIELIKEKRKIKVPQKALTKEEIAKNKKEEKEEILKQKEKDEKKETTKGEFFKVKESNVIAELRKKTIKIDENDKKSEKENMLKKLREYAKDITKKKKKNDLTEEAENELMKKDISEQAEEEEEY